MRDRSFVSVHRSDTPVCSMCACVVYTFGFSCGYYCCRGSLAVVVGAAATAGYGLKTCTARGSVRCTAVT